MPLIHAYTQTVADGTATSVVRPSDWNSAHNEVAYLIGNTAGISTVSGTNIVYQAGNNITVSGIQGAGIATIVFSGANTVAGGSGGGTVYQFSNANNVSFGTNGSTVTASASYPAQSAQPVAFSASGGSSQFSTLGFSNQANGVTFSNSNGSIALVHGLQQTSATSAITTNAINTSASSLFQQTGATSAITASAVNTSQTTNFVAATQSSLFQQTSATLAITSAAFPSSQTTKFVGTGTTFAGTNVTATMVAGSNGIALSLSAGAGGTGGGDGFNIVQIGSVGTTGTAFSSVSGTVQFNGSNNITVSQNNSNQIVISGPTLTQYLTTAALSQDSSKYAAVGYTSTTQAGSTAGVTHNTQGLSIAWPPFLTTAQSAGAYLTTARASNDAVGLNTAATNATLTVNSSGFSFNGAGYAGTGTTFAGTNVTATMAVGSNGVALSLSAAAAGGGGGTTNQTGPNIADQNGVTVTAGTVVFANSNGVSFGLNGSTMTASAAGGGSLFSNYEPMQLLSTTGISFGQNTLYVNSLQVLQPFTAKYMLAGVLMTGGWTTQTLATNSTVSTSVSSNYSAGQSFNFILFSAGTGGYSSNLYPFYTAPQMTMSTSVAWTQSNSNTSTGTQTVGSTVGFTYGMPIITSGTITSINAASSVTTWGTTTASFTNSSTFSTTGTSTSGWPGGTNNATWQGSRLLYIPFSTSLPAGNYWLGIQRSSTTTGGALAGTFSFLANNITTYDTNSRWAPMGYATAAAGQFTHLAGANGMFSSATYNSTSNYAGAFGSAGAIPRNFIYASSDSANQTGTVTRMYNRFMNEI